MFCHKDRTAVFVWLYGCLIRVNLQRNIHNFLFVESYHRTEYRHRTYFICCSKTLHGLASHLTDALSCDQSQAALLFSDAFRNLHHIPAHNDRQLIVWALIIDIQLNIRKVNHIQIDRSAVSCHQFCQIHNFLFCTFAGIWRCMEINSVNLYATFCDHISGYRRVNTTG